MTADTVDHIARTTPPTPQPATLSNEASVLGAVLTRRTAEQASELMASLRLDPLDFFSHKNRAVFAAMRALEFRAEPIDIVSLETQLERDGFLESVGGIAYLADLAMAVPTTENALYYAAQVRDRALGRRVAVAISEVVQAHRDGENSGSELLTLAMAAVASVDVDSGDEARTIGQIVQARMNQLEQIGQDRAAGKVAMTGLPTGIKALDDLLGGYAIGVATLLPARPGMGKSSLIMAGCDAISAAGFGVHHFSMEDSEEANSDRILSRWSEVPADAIRAVDFSRGDVSRLVHASARARMRSNWLIDTRSGRTAADIVRSVRLHRRKNNTRAVFVDYVTLLRSPDRRLNSEEAVAENMQTLANHAKEDNLAYIIGAQLNREIEKRADKRPTMSDLRGSGRLEEMCRQMVGLYRGSYYGGTPQRHVDWECDCAAGVTKCQHTPTASDWEGQAQLLILKNSGGKTGRVWAGWHGPTMRLW